MGWFSPNSRAATKRSPSRRLQCEPLEDRRMLSVPGVLPEDGPAATDPVTSGKSGAESWSEPLAEVEVFTDAACNTPGLVGSYVNANLRGYAAQDDWRVSQTISGTRVDETIDFQDTSWGSRAEVGLTGGSDSNWEYFSVQWDGYVQIDSAVALATRSDDSSRMWIDIDGDGTFESEWPEFVDNHWGTGQSATTGAASPMLEPGVYSIRLQYEEGSGGNIMQLLPMAPATVRVAYVVPSNRTAQPDAVDRLQYAVQEMQAWYREQMIRNGFGSKSFTYETESDGVTPKIHVVDVAETDDFLREDVWSNVGSAASNAGVPIWSSGQVWLLIPEIHVQNSDGSVDGGVALGGSWGSGMDGGVAMIGGNGLAVMGPEDLIDDTSYAGQILPSVGPYPLVQNVSYAWFEGSTMSSLCSTYLGATIHEMSHGFGMPHDFRNDSNCDGNVMGNGLRGIRGAILPETYSDDDMWLSYGQAMALSNSPYFNPDRLMPETVRPTVTMLTSGDVDPVDGLLHVAFTASDDTELAAAFITRNGDQVAELALDGTGFSGEFEIPYYTAGETYNYKIHVYDVYGNRTTADADITVSTGFNVAPQPYVDLSQCCIAVGQSLTLDASRTSDANDTSSSLLVEWDLDGNGVFDTLPSTRKTRYVTFDTPGIRRIQARVTDLNGAAALSAPIGIRVYIPGDLDYDGAVNSRDLDLVRGNWGDSVAPGNLRSGDPSGDGIVNSADLDIVRANWGRGTPTIAAARSDSESSSSAATDTLIGPLSAPASGSASTSPAKSPSEHGLSDSDLLTLAEAAWRREIEGLQARRQRNDAARSFWNELVMVER